MKVSFLPIVTFVIIIFAAASCYYDNEEALYPSMNSSCDTTNITFSGTIATILSNNCFSCHSNATSSFGGNIRLESFADVQANSARLITAIKQTGAKPMPPAGKLKACSISQFDIWIRNGTPNN